MTTKQKTLLALAAFLFINAFVALVSWCGGFNFDHRTEGVSIVVFLSGAFSISMAWCIYLFT